MSIKSNFSNIKNAHDKLYTDTHHRSNNKNLLNNDIYIDKPENNLNMNPANYKDLDNLCGLVMNNEGNISGDTYKDKNLSMYRMNKNDYIKKISDNSFISQFVPFDNYYIDNSKNKNKKNKINGIENDNFSKLDAYDDNTVDLTNINKLNTIQNNNFYDEYCYNKYQNIFNST